MPLTLQSTLKNKKVTPALELMSLPHDILLKCLACVPRLYYPTISLVSKRFQSLISSPELYKARSLFGHTESCLYVCVGYSYTLNRKWFTLSRKPDRAKTNETGYFLKEVRFPSGTRCVVDFSNLVAVGSDIYKIGELDKSSSVSILDCRTHTWREGPRLSKELTSLTAGVIDRKIYVAGRYKDNESNSSKNYFRVLDTRSGSWDHETIVPSAEATSSKFAGPKSACVDGKFYVKAIGEEFVYKPNEGRWDIVETADCRVVGQAMGDFVSLSAYCEVGNVFFCVHHCLVLGWYDTEVGGWKRVKGLEGLLPEFDREDVVRLTDYGGGKIAVFWEHVVHIMFSHGTKTIWCAVIQLERHKSGEFWGNVEWSDYMFSDPQCELVKALSVTL